MRRDKNLVDMSILQSGGYSSSKVLVKKEEERHEKLLELLSNKEESKIINGKISDLIPNDVMINYGFFCDFLPNDSFFSLKIYDLGNSIWALNF